MTSNVVKWLGLFSILLAVGCTTGAEVQKGIDAYMRGDLNGAMERWRTLEPETGDMNQKGFVRYLIYRGLTAFELGDQGQARRYLSQGRDAYVRGDSRWLPPNIAEKMNAALAQLGGPGERLGRAP
jgi:hypothetical protein